MLGGMLFRPNYFFLFFFLIRIEEEIVLLEEKRIPGLSSPAWQRAVSLARGPAAEPRGRAAAAAVLRAGGAPRTPALRNPPPSKTLRGAKRRPRWLVGFCGKDFPVPSAPAEEKYLRCGEGKRHPPARHRSAGVQLASPPAKPSEKILFHCDLLPTPESGFNLCVCVRSIF